MAVLSHRMSSGHGQAHVPWSGPLGWLLDPTIEACLTRTGLGTITLITGLVFTTARPECLAALGAGGSPATGLMLVEKIGLPPTGTAGTNRPPCTAPTGRPPLPPLAALAVPTIV